MNTLKLTKETEAKRFQYVKTQGNQTSWQKSSSLESFEVLMATSKRTNNNYMAVNKKISEEQTFAM